MRKPLLVAGVIVVAVGLAIDAIAALAAAEPGRFPRLRATGDRSGW